jgi:predicted DNA-binding WGR domain protein
MPTFELRDGRAHKRWAIHRDGAELTTEWGTIGAPQESLTRVYPSQLDAIEACREQIRSRRQKGYVRTLERRDDAGFAHDDVLARTVRRTFAAQDFAVYADYLQQAGDRRGELCALALAAEEGDGTAALAARKLTRELEESALGSAAPFLGEQLHVDYRWGHPVHVVVRGRLGATAPTLGELLTQPSFWFLRELDVQGEPLARLQGIGELRTPPRLRALTLELDDFVPPPDLVKMLEPYPELERLRLKAPYLHPVPLRVPQLIELELAYGPPLHTLTSALTDSELPALRTLRVAGMGADVLRALADAPALRALTTLDVTGCYLDDATSELLDAFASQYAHLRELRVASLHDELAGRGLRVA